MEISTQFSLNDIVYPVGRLYKTDSFSVRAAMPIDFISVSVGQSGIIAEFYGCEGTEEIYTNEDLFLTRNEAQTYADQLNDREKGCRWTTKRRETS